MGSRDYKILSPESRDWENQSGIAVHTGMSVGGEASCEWWTSTADCHQHHWPGTSTMPCDMMHCVSLVYCTEPTADKWKRENPPPQKTIMLRNSGKQSGESVESMLKKIKGCGRKDLQKRMVLSLECLQWWMLTVMSGYSVEERVPVMADWLQLT